MARGELEDLKDKLYVLEAAIEDVEGDLRDSDDPADVRAALEWLLTAARPLASALQS